MKGSPQIHVDLVMKGRAISRESHEQEEMDLAKAMPVGSMGAFNFFAKAMPEVGTENNGPLGPSTAKRRHFLVLCLNRVASEAGLVLTAFQAGQTVRTMRMARSPSFPG